MLKKNTGKEEKEKSWMIAKFRLCHIFLLQYRGGIKFFVVELQEA